MLPADFQVADISFTLEDEEVEQVSMHPDWHTVITVLQGWPCWGLQGSAGFSLHTAGNCHICFACLRSL